MPEGDSFSLVEPSNTSQSAKAARHAYGVSLMEWRMLPLEHKLDLIRYWRKCTEERQ